MAQLPTVRCLYDFAGENDAELSFRTGDIITVVSCEDEGWWEGELNGVKGLFPSNYVEQVAGDLGTLQASSGEGYAGYETNGQRFSPKGRTPRAQPIPESKPLNGAHHSSAPSSGSYPPASKAKQYMSESKQPANSYQQSLKPLAPQQSQQYHSPLAAAAAAAGYFNNDNSSISVAAPSSYSAASSQQAAVVQYQARQQAANLDVPLTIRSAHGETRSGRIMEKGSTLPAKVPTSAYQVDGSFTGALPGADGTSGYKAVMQGVPIAAGGAAEYKPRESRTKFGVWSSNMAWISGFSAIGISSCALLWNGEDGSQYGTLTIVSGAVGLVLGVATIIYEYNWGQARSEMRFPLRGLVYLAISAIYFLSLPTLMIGVMYVCVGLANVAASYYGEVYDRPIPPEKIKSAAHISSNGPADYIEQQFQIFRQSNKIGTIIFLLAYVAGNIALFIYSAVTIAQQNNSLPSNTQLTNWAPIAKGFGRLLDLNGAIVLLPVLRTMIRWLYDKSTADQGCLSRTLRALLFVVPLDQNVRFHRLVGEVILWSTVGHTLAHYINYSITPSQTINTYHLYPWVSGGILCVIIMIMFSSSEDNVKRGQFEIFWYSHHLFPLFFIFLLTHGHNGLSPWFWMFFIGPGTLYVLERIARIYRGRLQVVLLSVTLMDDVISLEFAKSGIFAQPYKEGQYVFLQCPGVSLLQWHPFTISSAPQEKSVTLHIRCVNDAQAWTHRLKQYCMSMGPRNATYFQLDRQGSTGKLLGKILGPDGKPMFSMDGPHSAPTQHAGEYSVVMVAGSGIGVTPVAATLKSVVFHRWKYFIGKAFPDHAYFFWMCAHKDIDGFRWLIRVIKEAQDEVLHMRQTNPQNMASKSFAVHIFVTSVPRGQKPIDVVVDDEIGFWGQPHEESNVEKYRSNWDEGDLYREMYCPAGHTVMGGAGDVHVYNGRPDWGAHFSRVSQSHASEPVGVMFCGNKYVAKDLKNFCYLNNKIRGPNRFILHKENF